MSATYVKFEAFVGDLWGKVHDLLGTAGSSADTIKAVLTLTGPNAATGAVLADLTQIAGSGGYTTGGASVANVGARSGGTLTLTGTNVTWTSDGSLPDFRYVALYNDTASGDPLIGYWDYGSTLALDNNGDTFTVKFNNGASSGTIITAT